MRKNRRECKKITALSLELVGGLLAATEGVGEDELSDDARLSLADLEW